MNSHKHARTTYAIRVEMVSQLQSGALNLAQASRTYGITVRTVRKWWQRFLTGGQSSLADASSAPKRSPVPCHKARPMPSCNCVSSAGCKAASPRSWK